MMMGCHNTVKEDSLQIWYSILCLVERFQIFKSFLVIFGTKQVIFLYKGESLDCIDSCFCLILEIILMIYQISIDEKNNPFASHSNRLVLLQLPYQICIFLMIIQMTVLWF